MSDFEYTDKNLKSQVKTHKLKLKYSLNAAQDLKVAHGFDIEKEISKILDESIVLEVATTEEKALKKRVKENLELILDESENYTIRMTIENTNEVLYERKNK